MLFVLTGDVQIGKTRWLQRLVADVEDAEDAGGACAGVLAPGEWAEPAAGADGIERREKLGIFNELLPGHERIRFARRRDLAQREGTFRVESQSARAQLAWEIDDAAIERVNAHFVELAGEADAATDGGSGRARLLIVDELGRLELLCGGGLTEAMVLLDRGPTAFAQTALIVVRDWLVSRALERFEPAWGEGRVIAPTEEARAVVWKDLFRG